MGDGDAGGEGRGGIRETEVAEFFAQHFDEFGADLVLVVVFKEIETLGDAGVTADGGDVDHAVPLEVWRVSIGTGGSTERLPPPPPSPPPRRDASTTIPHTTQPIELISSNSTNPKHT